MLTPAAMRSAHLRARMVASSDAISARVFAPSTSAGSEAFKATTVALLFTSSAAMSVR